MSCIPCLECGNGATVSRENIDRWTDSIVNALASRDGRLHFRRYLETRSLEDGLNNLEFWEQCTRIMPKKTEGSDSPPLPSPASTSMTGLMMQEGSSGHSHSYPSHHLPGHSHRDHSHQAHSQSPPREVAVSKHLHRDLEKLVQFADDCINFDLSLMRRLYRMLQAADESKVIEVLTEARQTAMELLLDDYQLFRKHLLESRGLLHD